MSANNGSRWYLTTRLSTGAENNRQPCLAITDEDTTDGVPAVWQVKKINGKYKVYYRKSSDSDASWGDPVLLADEISCSSYQSAGPMPVVTSVSYSNSYKLIVVWLNNAGLKYRTAYNGEWSTTGALDDYLFNLFNGVFCSHSQISSCDQEKTLLFYLIFYIISV